MTKLYDLSKLEKIAPDPVFIKKMVQLFLEQTPEALDKINTCYKDGDLEGMANAAHKIKPSLDHLGINSLHEPIRAVESLGKAGNNNQALVVALETVNQTLPQVFEQLTSAQA